MVTIIKRRFTDQFGYTHPRKPGLIDLSLNESVWGPSPKVKEAVKSFDEFGMYPDDIVYKRLRESIAKVYSLRPENIVLTDAGIGALDLIFSAFLPCKIHISRPTFDPIVHRFMFYGHRAFSFNEAEMYVTLNPNNPTGEPAQVSVISKALDTNKTVLVDEEYSDYSEMSLLNRYIKSVIVTRSFSKAYGLPSMRVGWITCDPTLAEYLRDIRYPWRIGRLSCILATIAVEDQEYHKDVVERTVRIREIVQDSLKDLNPLPSQANYIMIKTPRKLTHDLLKRGFIVRDLYERTGYEAIRFTITDEVTMRKFCRVLKEIWR